MPNLFNLLLHDPFLNILIVFYNTIAFKNLGLAIIFLTALIRIILFPVFQKSVRHQAEMRKIQPKLKKVQELHKRDKTKQAEATMALYKAHNLNPFSGILLILIQLPVLIALYQIFLRNLTPDSLIGLYSFVSPPADLNDSFLGLISLREQGIVGGNILILFLAALAQYFQGKLSLPQGKDTEKKELSQAEKMAKRMVFIGPVFTVVIFSGLPAAVGLYWLTTSIFSVIQQSIVNRELNGELGKFSKENS